MNPRVLPYKYSSMEYRQEALCAPNASDCAINKAKKTANMTDPVSLNRNDLCSVLGYEKDNPGKNRGDLLKATTAFLMDLESRGIKIPPGKKVDPVEARLCAVNFLEEDGRGDKFWPHTSDESLTYEKDHLTQYLKSKKKSDNSRSNIEKDEQSSTNNIPTSMIPEESEDEIEAIYRSSLNSIKPELSLTPWLDPPKRFDRNVAIPWVDSLDPIKFQDVSFGWSSNWLSQRNSKWPPLADKQLQYFMHQNLFYYTVNLESTDERIQSLVEVLKRGMSAGEMDSTHLREFRTRIVDRIKHHTESFINHQFVEMQDDGPQMTGRFRNIWTSRYGMPSTNTTYRRRQDVPSIRESPRKRRKLSKKAEDNATDDDIMRKKSANDHAGKRKVARSISVPIFPNLLARKDSNLDSMEEEEAPIIEEEEKEMTKCLEPVRLILDASSQICEVVIPSPQHTRRVPPQVHTEMDSETESTIAVEYENMDLVEEPTETQITTPTESTIIQDVEMSESVCHESPGEISKSTPEPSNLMEIAQICEARQSAMIRDFTQPSMIKSPSQEKDSTAHTPTETRHEASTAKTLQKSPDLKGDHPQSESMLRNAVLSSYEPASKILPSPAVIDLITPHASPLQNAQSRTLFSGMQMESVQGYESSSTAQMQAKEPRLRSPIDSATTTIDTKSTFETKTKTLLNNLDALDVFSAFPRVRSSENPISPSTIPPTPTTVVNNRSGPQIPDTTSDLRLSTSSQTSSTNIAQDVKHPAAVSLCEETNANTVMCDTSMQHLNDKKKPGNEVNKITLMPHTPEGITKSPETGDNISCPTKQGGVSGGMPRLNNEQTVKPISNQDLRPQINQQVQPNDFQPATPTFQPINRPANPTVPSRSTPHLTSQTYPFTDSKTSRTSTSQSPQLPSPPKHNALNAAAQASSSEMLYSPDSIRNTWSRDVMIGQVNLPSIPVKSFDAKRRPRARSQKKKIGPSQGSAGAHRVNIIPRNYEASSLPASTPPQQNSSTIPIGSSIRNSHASNHGQIKINHLGNDIDEILINRFARPEDQQASHDPSQNTDRAKPHTGLDRTNVNEPQRWDKRTNSSQPNSLIPPPTLNEQNTSMYHRGQIPQTTDQRRIIKDVPGARAPINKKTTHESQKPKPSQITEVFQNRGLEPIQEPESSRNILYSNQDVPRITPTTSNNSIPIQTSRSSDSWWNSVAVKYGLMNVIKPSTEVATQSEHTKSTGDQKLKDTQSPAPVLITAPTPRPNLTAYQPHTPALKNSPPLRPIEPPTAAHYTESPTSNKASTQTTPKPLYHTPNQPILPRNSSQAGPQRPIQLPNQHDARSPTSTQLIQSPHPYSVPVQPPLRPNQNDTRSPATTQPTQSPNLYNAPIQHSPRTFIRTPSAFSPPLSATQPSFQPSVQTKPIQPPTNAKYNPQSNGPLGPQGFTQPFSPHSMSFHPISQTPQISTPANKSNQPAIQTLIHPTNLHHTHSLPSPINPSTPRTLPPKLNPIASPHPNPLPTPQADTFPMNRPKPNPLQLLTPMISPNSSSPSPPGPKLDFFCQRANFSIDTQDALGHELIQTLSSSAFFTLFAHKSGIPFHALEEITFRCMFGQYQQFVVRKDGGDSEWKRARKRVWRVWEGELMRLRGKGDGSEEDEVWEVNVLIGRVNE